MIGISADFETLDFGLRRGSSATPDANPKDALWAKFPGPFVQAYRFGPGTHKKCCYAQTQVLQLATETMGDDLGDSNRLTKQLRRVETSWLVGQSDLSSFVIEVPCKLHAA